MLSIWKKTLCLGLAVALLLAGCAQPAREEPAPRPPTPVKQPFDTLVDDLSLQYAIPMPLALDDQLVQELLGLEAEAVADYRGYISMLPGCADHLLAVRSAAESAEDICRAMQQRLDDLGESYAQWPDALEAIRGGQAFFYKDYAFLVVTGQPGDDHGALSAEIAKKLTDNFEK